MAQATTRPHGPPLRLLTIQQTAGELNCSTKSTRRLMEKGALRAVRIGRAVRVTRESVEQFVAAGGAP